jgi:hypothetical protein
MLEYYKWVLDNVSFDETLTKNAKALALKHLPEKERGTFKNWCSQKFPNLT